MYYENRELGSKIDSKITKKTTVMTLPCSKLNATVCESVNSRLPFLSNPSHSWPILHLTSGGNLIIWRVTIKKNTNNNNI